VEQAGVIGSEPKKNSNKKNRRGGRTEPHNVQVFLSSRGTTAGSTDRSRDRGWLLSAGNTGEENGRVE
jgi:hypothetical protein